MDERRIYRETLYEAAVVLGGVDRLALRLNADVDALNAWIAGAGKPPLPMFLEALEAISEGPWRAAGR